MAWAPVLTSVPVVLGPSGFLGVGGGAICVGSGGGLLPPLLPIPPPAQPEMTAKASRTMQPSSSRCDCFIGEISFQVSRSWRNAARRAADADRMRFPGLSTTISSDALFG